MAKPPPSPNSATVRRQRQFTRRSSPSSIVLSLLATITAASSAVDGSPLLPQNTPPTFLCPSIRCDVYDSDDNIPSPNLIQPSVVHGGAQPGSLKYGKRSQVADKFEQGPDGRWRQADVYTLYGSTICSVGLHAFPAFTAFINPRIELRTYQCWR